MAIEQLKLEKQVSFRLYTASRLVAQLYEPLLKTLGITYTQYLVFLVLWENDGMPVNDIAKKLYLGVNTISPLIKRLVVLELVEVKTCDADRRKQLVFLTSKGKEMEAAAAHIPLCLSRKIQACGIKMKDINPLIPLLDNVIQHLVDNKEKE